MSHPNIPIDLRRLDLSVRAAKAWFEKSVVIAESLITKYKSSDIPDEQAEILPDGRLRIFLEIENKVIAEMFVPASEWVAHPVN